MSDAAVSDACKCGHSVTVHDQYGCVTCWNEMGDPCDIPDGAR